MQNIDQQTKVKMPKYNKPKSSCHTCIFVVISDILYTGLSARVIKKDGIKIKRKNGIPTTRRAPRITRCESITFAFFFATVYIEVVAI
jgi:hypothetical protein